jgi:hypothetical protein
VIRKLWRVLLVLWAGSLWSLALWVTWTLFQLQPDRHLAGVLAARLFSIECYLGIAVAGLNLLLPGSASAGRASAGGAAAGRAQFLGGYLAAAVLAINEWALRPVMETARAQGTALRLTFGAWHGVSSILYIMACVAVLVSIWDEDFR